MELKKLVEKAQKAGLNGEVELFDLAFNGCIVCCDGSNGGKLSEEEVAN